MIYWISVKHVHWRKRDIQVWCVKSVNKCTAVRWVDSFHMTTSVNAIGVSWSCRDFNTSYWRQKPSLMLTSGCLLCSCYYPVNAIVFVQGCCTEQREGWHPPGPGLPTPADGETQTESVQVHTRLPLQVHTIHLPLEIVMFMNSFHLYEKANDGT